MSEFTGCDNSRFDLILNSVESEKHIDKMLHESSLSQLSEIHQHTTKKLRDLEIKMQNLVYDNYNKFISATNAVKNMKLGLEEMDPEISKMGRSVESITDITSEIQKSLGSARKSLISCYSYETCLKRLQILLNLPQRLKEYAENKNYGPAVEFYLKTRSFYNQTTNSNLSTVSAHAQAIMSGIVDELLKIVRVSQEEAELTKAVDLLLRLGHDPLMLAQHYITGANESLERNLENLTAQSTNDDYLTFLHSLSIVSLTFEKIFKASPMSDEIVTTNAKIISRMFEKISERDVVMPLIRRMSSLNCVMPHLFKLDVEKIFLNVLHSRISNHVENLERRVRSKYSTLSLDFREGAHMLHLEIVNGVTESLVALNAFVGVDDSPLPPRETQFEIVYKFLFELIDRVVRMKFTKQEMDETEGLIFIVQAKLCTFLSNTTIPQLILLITSSKRMPDGFAAFIADIRDESAKMLGLYAKYHGCRFSMKLVNSFDWNGTTIDGASEGIQTICRVLRDIFVTLKPIFPDYESPNVTNSESSILSSVRHQKDSKWYVKGKDSTILVMNSISRLFAERILIYCPLESNQIFQGIMKIFLKNFSEYIRLCTLNVVVVRQIQVDMCFLSQLPNTSSTELFALFDEVMASAVARCEGDCQLMESQFVDDIIHKDVA